MDRLEDRAQEVVHSVGSARAGVPDPGLAPGCTDPYVMVSFRCPVRCCLTPNRHEVTEVVSSAVLAPHPESLTTSLLVATPPSQPASQTSKKAEAVCPWREVYKCVSPILGSGPICSTARST